MSELSNEQFQNVGNPGLLSSIVLVIIIVATYAIVAMWKKVSG